LVKVLCNESKRKLVVIKKREGEVPSVAAASARSKRNPTTFEEADFNSFHRDKSRAFNYPHYHKDIEINKYHGLPLLHLCFQLAQPYTEACLVSSNTSDEVDINSMTIAKYELYIAKQELRKNPLNDHSNEDYNNWVRIGVENLRKQEEAKVDDCDEGNRGCYLVPDVIDDVIQPLIPQTLHTTLPDKDYVASATP
ncbi:hypothetical protein Tco_1170878, partial [Tanacetum coccineum]